MWWRTSTCSCPAKVGLSAAGRHASWLRVSLIGSILRADVDGQVLMRAYLSGTPECKFGLNDKLVLDRRYVPSLTTKAWHTD